MFLVTFLVHCCFFPLYKTSCNENHKGLTIVENRQGIKISVTVRVTVPTTLQTLEIKLMVSLHMITVYKWFILVGLNCITLCFHPCTIIKQTKWDQTDSQLTA